MLINTAAFGDQPVTLVCFHRPLLALARLASFSAVAYNAATSTLIAPEHPRQTKRDSILVRIVR
jgi:hypothetical protein